MVMVQSVPVSPIAMVSPVDSDVLLRSRPQGLPWWRSGWESTCQCRGHGFEPWSGRIPHAPEQLGPCATATEPELQSPQATTTEARAPRAHAPQQEEPTQ